jgi:hypothetical protein
MLRFPRLMVTMPLLPPWQFPPNANCSDHSTGFTAASFWKQHEKKSPVLHPELPVALGGVTLMTPSVYLALNTVPSSDNSQENMSVWAF